MSEHAHLTVSALNLYIKTKFDTDEALKNIYLVGELSNVKYYPKSGHWYFSLKDDKSAISAVMFKSSAYKLTFKPKDGDQVLAFGRVSVFERDGRYQFYVEKMLPQGAGDLQRRLEALKAKLLEEGVFKSDETRKLLNKYPKKVVLVTSPVGAVIRDMVTTIRRRTPQVDIVLIPANVQGALGVDSITSALDKAYQLKDVDAIIVGRGGGSIEDLWCFNEEKVVKKIAESPVPIISAVGHETDTTLSDWAADYRAGTPSIAAEMVAQDNQSTLSYLDSLTKLLTTALEQTYHKKKQALAYLLKDSVFVTPQKLLTSYYQALDSSEEALEKAFKMLYDHKKTAFSSYIDKLEALNPLAILKRGYAYATKPTGKVIISVEDIKPKDELVLCFSDGKASAIIKDREKNDGE